MKVSGQPHAPAASTLWKEMPVPTGQEAGWAPELVLMNLQREKSLPLLEIEPWSSSP